MEDEIKIKIKKGKKGKKREKKRKKKKNKCTLIYTLSKRHYHP